MTQQAAALRPKASQPRAGPEDAHKSQPVP